MGIDVALFLILLAFLYQQYRLTDTIMREQKRGRRQASPARITQLEQEIYGEPVTMWTTEEWYK